MKEDEEQDGGSSQDSSKDDGVTEDSQEEGGVTQDYHEDYDSFPFGSRLPSVILPGLNEVEGEELEETGDILEEAEEEEGGEEEGVEKETVSTETAHREVDVEVSTSKPRYVIRKLSRKRVPKTLIKERRERALESSMEYQPVHRGGKVKLVMVQGQGYVPEHSLEH